MKICARCFVEKPYTEFAAGPRYRDGYQSYCRACMREYRAEKRKDPEWERKERERIRDHFRNNEEARTRNRNAGRVRDRVRWHTDEKFRDRKRSQDRDRYQTDPKTHTRRIASSKISTHIRRARIRGTGGHFTQQEWRDLCEHYGNKCLKCGEQKPLTPDHVVPLSRGGSNDIDNIQPLCLDCNLRKHAKTIDYRLEWEG